VDHTQDGVTLTVKRSGSTDPKEPQHMELDTLPESRLAAKRCRVDRAKRSKVSDLNQGLRFETSRTRRPRAAGVAPKPCKAQGASAIGMKRARALLTSAIAARAPQVSRRHVRDQSIRTCSRAALERSLDGAGARQDLGLEQTSCGHSRVCFHCDYGNASLESAPETIRSSPHELKVVQEVGHDRGGLRVVFSTLERVAPAAATNREPEPAPVLWPQQIVSRDESFLLPQVFTRCAPPRADAPPYDAPNLHNPGSRRARRRRAGRVRPQPRRRATPARSRLRTARRPPTDG
jgi:hypothetical protein